MIQSPEMASKISRWRQLGAEGRLTEADMVEAIAALRGGRVGAQIASDTSRRKKAKVEIPTADDMLDELGDLG